MFSRTCALQHTLFFPLSFVSSKKKAGDILHLDSMEIYQKMMVRARQGNPLLRTGGTFLGIGVLIGYLCLLHGKSKGCKVAEFLAIDDSEKQHRRLVSYYRRGGFKVIKYVGDGAGDIPDRLVWGGRGTLMREDIDTLLQIWTRLLSKEDKAKKK
mmetsp:Transcript_20255/g.46911  ORF Transcript_20255/g.46911 Transcript_20255/m.46911 type:complete len:155 (+) Transcript_20255:385-849(+)